MKNYFKTRMGIWNILNIWMKNIINRETPNIVGFFGFLAVLSFYVIALIPSLYVEGFIYKSLSPITTAVVTWGAVKRDAISVITGKDDMED